MTDAPSPNLQESLDHEHLKLLAIFHYFVGALTILFSSICIIHIVIGITIATNPEAFSGPKQGHGPPAIVGYFFAIIGTVVLLMGWTFGGLTIFAGRSIQQRRRRLMTLIVAGLNCAWYPFGTALGVCTLIVLSRESVKKMFTS